MYKFSTRNSENVFDQPFWRESQQSADLWMQSAQAEQIQYNVRTRLGENKSPSRNRL